MKRPLLEERLRSLNSPLVDVHNISDFLKRIKRYAGGRMMRMKAAGYCEFQVTRGRPGRAREEVEVF